MRFLKSVLIVFAVVSVGSCGRIWDAVNRTGLQSDVEELLAENGVPNPTVLSCQMVGTTRAGVCRLIIGEDEVATFIENIGLVQFDPEAAEQVSFLNSVTSVSTECINLDDLHSDQSIWLVYGRPTKLKIGDGSSFEYLVLTYWSSEALACFRVSYSYG